MFLPETETSGDYFNHQKQVKQMMCAPDQIRAVQSVETAPISTQFVLNILLGNPVFIANQQFQFCVIGIWWGRVGLPRVETLMLEIRRGHRLLTEGPGSGADSSTMTGYL